MDLINKNSPNLTIIQSEFSYKLFFSSEIGINPQLFDEFFSTFLELKDLPSGLISQL